MPGIDTGVSVARSAQQIQQVVMAQLLASIEQAGQLQTPVARVDSVQISAQAQALAAGER